MTIMDTINVAKRVVFTFFKVFIADERVLLASRMNTNLRSILIATLTVNSGKFHLFYN